MLSLLDDEAAAEAAAEAAVEAALEDVEVTEADVVVVVDSASCCCCPVSEVKLAAKSAATDSSAAAAVASEDLRLHEVEYGEALASRLARRFALRSSMIRRNCSIFSRVTWIWSSTLLPWCRLQSSGWGEESPAAAMAIEDKKQYRHIYLISPQYPLIEKASTQQDPDHQPIYLPELQAFGALWL